MLINYISSISHRRFDKTVHYFIQINLVALNGEIVDSAQADDVLNDLRVLHPDLQISQTPDALGSAYLNVNDGLDLFLHPHLQFPHGRLYIHHDDELVAEELRRGICQLVQAELEG